MLRAQPPVHYYEATYASICITARRLTHRPRAALSLDSGESISLLTTNQATGLLTLTPVRFVPH
jgi:hypothetical protein